MQSIIWSKVITLDPKRSGVDAVLIDGRRIIAINTIDQLKRMSPKAKIIDKRDCFLTPGLCDAHIHLVSYGLKLANPDLSTAKSTEEVLYLLKEQCKNQNGSIFSTGFEQNRLREPTLSELDQIAPNNPLLLRSRDGHVAWANSEALKLAGLNDFRLLEEKIGLLEKSLPGLKFEDLVLAAKRANDDLVARGFTSVHTMAFEPPEFLQAVCELDRRGELGLQVWACIGHEELGQEFADSARVKIRGVKFFADGSLSSRTAWFKQPYLDTKTCGISVDSPDLIFEKSKLAIKYGLTPVVHAIGDQAVSEILRIFDQIKHLAERKNINLRLEHVQHVDSSDFGLFKDIVASVQPIHFLDDASLIERILGSERAKNAFPLRRLADAGAKIIFGSDAPVAKPEPLTNLQTAVGLGLTPFEALLAHTAGPLAPGALAEFTFWEKDPITTI